MPVDGSARPPRRCGSTWRARRPRPPWNRWRSAPRPARRCRPDGGSLLRRRQHAGTGRIDRPLRPRPRRAQVLPYSDVAGALWAQIQVPCHREGTRDVAEGRRRCRSSPTPHRRTRRTGRGDLRRVHRRQDLGGTRAPTQRHLDAGQQVWLVTATPVELAQTIADRLGLTGALGTVAESEDGIFTGRLVGDVLHGLGKAHAVNSLAIREGLNLQRCTAYSDSHNVPMLSSSAPPSLSTQIRTSKTSRRCAGGRVYDFRVARRPLSTACRRRSLSGRSAVARPPLVRRAAEITGPTTTSSIEPAGQLKWRAAVVSRSRRCRGG